MAAARAGGATGPSIDSQVAAQQGKVLARRDKIDELRKMQANIDILRDEAKRVTGRATELGTEASSNESGLTMLGSAVAPSRPSWPDIPMIVGVACIGGFVLGLLIAMGIELVARRVRGPEDLALTGVPVLGVITSRAAAKHRKTLWEWIGISQPASA